MADRGQEIDLVADILRKPFSRRTFPEKLGIVGKGRPTPKLASLSQPGKGFIRHFQFSNYKRYPWLTASEERCKLYCWECLLFATDRLGVWSHTGFANLSCLTKAAARHQSTAGHLQATVLLKTFGETRVDLQISEQVRRETELHNEKVKKNREILERLIDCVIFLGKQELSFRGHDESAGCTNRGNYLELLSFLAENNVDLHYHLSTNKVFCGTSGKMQSDLIDAVAEVMGEEVRREINKAQFVAVMVDEAADAREAAQLALVLRYATGAGVKERFVRFEDVASGERADGIAALIVRFLEEYQCLGKVVAQCFDGTPVMSSGLNSVQAKVKERAPMALFVHCYAHRLNSVLTQGASKLKECKLFFAHLKGLAAFFSRSPRCAQLLDDICRRRLPRAAPTRWQHASRLVSTVLEKRVALKELFRHILDHHDEYDEEAVRCADGFGARLDDFEFCFLLHAFTAIFEYADMLFAIMQSKTLDVQFCLAKVKEFCGAIERERDRFGEIHEATARISSARGDLRAYYQQLHSDIVDNILCQTRSRFQDHEKLMFLSLLDPQQFPTYRKKFPHAAFSSLSQSHGTLFDLSRLKTELTVMYAMTDFEGKSPAALLNFLQHKNLGESMGQLYTLACLAVTVPVSAASAERTFSALKRIKTYTRNTTGHTRLTALASMAIEKDLLLELKRTDNLYNRVIELFLRKERRVDFMYKIIGSFACINLGIEKKHQDSTEQETYKNIMAEPGGEQSSGAPHSVLPESDCCGNATTPHSEELAVVDTSIKTEPVEQDICQPACCTDMQGFSAVEPGSGLHLVVVKVEPKSELLDIKEESDGGELCSTTATLCFPSEQLNPATCLLASQCRSQTGEVMAEQNLLLQEPSVLNTEMHEAGYCIREKHEVIEGDQLSSSPLTEQQTDAVSAGQNSLPNDLLQKSLTDPNSSSAAAGALEQFVRPGTSGIGDKASEQPCHDNVTAETRNSKNFQCIQYGKTFSQANVLKEHQRVYSGEKPYMCHLCGKRFNYRSILTSHYRIHSGEKPYKCSLCGKSFSDRGNLRNHQLFHCGEKSYKCCQCEKSFFCQRALTKHQFVHFSVKPYKCNQCEKSFFYERGLKAHRVVHCHEKLFVCSECSKSFSRADNLKKHQVVHSREKPFRCDKCQKSFSRADNLKQHQVVHSKVKPYKCSQCEKSFFYESILKVHQVVHSREKPFACDKCPKSLSRAGDLKRHQAVHSREKPFACDKCPKTFSRTGDLKRHQAVHSCEKPFGCDKCSKSFSRAGDLKKHQVVHSREKPFGCDKCPKRFSRADNLKQHQVVHSHENPH